MPPLISNHGSRTDWVRQLSVPFALSAAILLAWWVQWRSGSDPGVLGIRPGEWDRWYAILTAPFAHGSVAHLFGNITTLFLASSLVFIFYRHWAFLVHTVLWILTGLLMMLIARPGVSHIGASGVVYALLVFLIIAGWFSRSRSHRVLSLFLIMYYGSMLWGLFPIEEKISWDGHLAGALSGIIMALMLIKRIRNQYADTTPEWMKDHDSGDDPYAPFGDS